MPNTKSNTCVPITNPNNNLDTHHQHDDITKNIESMIDSAEKINKCLLDRSNTTNSTPQKSHLSDAEFTHEYIKYITAKNNIERLPNPNPINLPILLIPLVEPTQSIDPSESALYHILTPQNPPIPEDQMEGLKQDFGAIQKHKYMGSHNKTYNSIDFSSVSFLSRATTLMFDSASTIKHAFSNIGLTDFANSKAATLALANAGGWIASESAGMAISALTATAYIASSLKDSWDEVQKEKVRKDINGIAFNNQLLFPDHETLDKDSNNNITIGALNKKLKIMHARVYESTQYSPSPASIAW